MRVVLLSVRAGRGWGREAEAMTADYLRRLMRPFAGEETTLRTEPLLMATVEALSKGGAVALVVADGGGQAMSSEGFSTWVRLAREGGKRTLVMAVGPADGWSAEARAEWKSRGALVLSLGPMTLPHELARLVLVMQFLKGSWDYGELHAATENFGGALVIKQLGRGFVKVGGAETDPEDLRLVEEGWQECVAAMESGEWDVVILDEILYTIGYGMLDAEAVAAAVRRKPEMLHVILTGRNAPPVLVELADTVTEMREVKHAYTRGILAQRGIEF